MQGVDELRRFTATGIALLMDRVLPRCGQLESLYVSASEISINVFILIPPSLRHLKIQAYNVSAPVCPGSHMLAALWGLTFCRYGGAGGRRTAASGLLLFLRTSA